MVTPITTIAMAGKGGTGKTTIAGWAINYMISNGTSPILVVDGDSNANLNDVLGLEVTGTLSDLVEGMKKGSMPPMTRDILMERKVHEIIIEANGYDLLVMGRPEGPGCYCLANDLLASIIEKLISKYPKVVIDNQAGMEFLSRLILKTIDILYVVSDSSHRGLNAAHRIWELVDELSISVRYKYLILNKVKDEVSSETLDEIQKKGLILAGAIPENGEVYHWDQVGKATSKINPMNPAVRVAHEIFARTMNGGEILPLIQP